MLLSKSHFTILRAFKDLNSQELCKKSVFYLIIFVLWIALLHNTAIEKFLHRNTNKSRLMLWTHSNWSGKPNLMVLISSLIKMAEAIFKIWVGNWKQSLTLISRNTLSVLFLSPVKSFDLGPACLLHSQINFETQNASHAKYATSVWRSNRLDKGLFLVPSKTLFIWQETAKFKICKRENAERFTKLGDSVLAKIRTLERIVISQLRNFKRKKEWVPLPLQACVELEAVSEYVNRVLYF